MKKTIYILDCMGLIFRSYHAIAPMSNSQGTATHATYGFIRTLLKILKDYTPEYLACVFDGENNKKSRLKIDPNYKANRPPPPPDLKEQIRYCLDACETLELPILNLPGVEADDSIATLSRAWEKQGGEVVILSSDKDLCQLVSPHITLLNIYKNNLKTTPQKVEEIYGISVSQFIDYLALIGDSSDNVPGVAGIGPKTASTLLNEFGSLENLLANTDKIKSKKRQETLQKEASIARMSRELVVLDETLDIPTDQDHYQVYPNPPLLTPLLEDLEFFSILKELAPQQESCDKSNYHLIETEQELESLIQKISSQKECAIDTETTSIHPLRGNLVGISLSYTLGEAYYIPFNHKLSKELLKKNLSSLFQKEISWIGHNIKYDSLVLEKAGLPLAKIGFDTAIASYVLNAHSHRHSLDELSLTYFGKTKISIKSLIGTGQKQITMDQAPINEVCTYACEDADYTFRLKELLAPEVSKRGLDKLYYELELPLLSVLAHMEKTGIYVDNEHLLSLSKRMHKYLAALEQEIHTLAGEEFKVNSPKQLSHILYDKLGIPPPKKTATGFSTNAEVLDFLRSHHPIIEKVIDYRLYEKLRSTYVDALPQEIHPETKRIHPSFNQITASTGRLSCQNPNLQNIPIRTEQGREIRESFKPQKEDWIYLSLDYSQIELRILAHLSEDPSLLKAFCEGEDIHSFTASQVFQVPLEEVTKEMRYHAKTVNFGIIYGQQAFGLAKELKIGIPEASRFIENYFNRYPSVKSFIEKCHEIAREKGYTETLTGRQRKIPDISHKNRNLRTQAERLAVNSPIQGLAADIIKMAMLEVDLFARKNKLTGKLILQIHDELLFELPNSELPLWQQGVKEIMENVYPLKVPLTVDLSIGKNWRECYN